MQETWDGRGAFAHVLRRRGAAMNSRIKKSIFQFAVCTAVVAFVVLCVYLYYSYESQSSENERRALAEARVLAAEAGASWDYIDSIQDRINYSHGELDFKDVYCSVAGKNIAKRFSEQSDYSIRYVRDNPRSLDDEPDAFEAQALASFALGDATEYYEVVEDGESVTFRYLSKLAIDRGCLQCHGQPAGEKDITGYVMEGMAEGDVAGAVSITMPLDAIVADARENLASTVVFFCVLMACVTAILAWGLRRWIAAPMIDENEKLRRESEDQSNFLTIITHELKTPLSSILAFTELWKERSVKRQADPEELELVQEVEINGRVLLDMINNALDTAKLEAGTLAPASGELDVYDLVGQVSSTMGPLAKRKRVAFSTTVAPGVPVVRADAEVLRRIVVNLVNNALRFTPAGGAVRLEFSYEQGVLSISVSDTGCGISADQLPYVFDRFVSAPGSETTSEGGTGLGLSIVRKFADMMGGEVSVESEVGRGSVFAVRLPLDEFEIDEVGEGGDL